MSRLGSTKTALHRYLAETVNPVYVIDAQFTLVYCSPPCAAWVGIDEDQLIGQPCRYHSNPQRGTTAYTLAGLCPPPQALRGERVSFVAEARAGESLQRRQGESLPLFNAKGDCSGAMIILASQDSPIWEERSLLTQGDEPLHYRLREFRRRLARRFDLDRLAGESLVMSRVRSQAIAAAKSRANAVIVGPQGSGREHVARAIHYARRSDPPAPLAAVDCALADSELLQATVVALIQRGLEKRSSDPGTLLLLNVDQLALDSQTELAGFFSLPDFCLNALATARRPLTDYGEDRFRPDLALQLSTITIALPALAERRDDIPLLAQWFLEEANAESERQYTGFDESALDVLAAHPWMGNLDELSEIVRQARQYAEGPWVTAADLPESLRLAADAATYPVREVERIVLDEYLETLERELIQRALRQAKGNKTQAAELLGVSRARLHRRCEQWGLE